MEIKQDVIPTTNTNRPGDQLNATHITIHETANTNTGADAEMHARYVKGEEAQNRQVSWHYTVDDKQIIQHLPTNEIGWHAGSEGNAASIGIELCVNEDGSFSKTKQKAMELIQSLKASLSIPYANVVTHHRWTGKNCPARLLNDWEAFKKELRSEEGAESIAGQRIVIEAHTLWVYDRPDWDARYTTVTAGEVFTLKDELLVDSHQMYQLKSGLYITANDQYVKMLP
ncbi:MULTISPECIES: N-acetylmuramoyl-L-alanine amidase [Salimicrobium]|uniref:N-acetylmuramoyl-L-alanine amidase n=1 Tax=Salimicrobium humidisoli TaxID=2029857 RepID=A0ABX4HN85_9BACI|nr:MULTISPECIES: N-acetylmuramoyl-L-alanine amidase [Salimicrobium]PBB04657.1 N-acetylmuramoyl-L-alanine amidase [Salimicrobium humidisoli]